MHRYLKIKIARRKDADSIIHLVSQLSKYEKSKSFFRKKHFFLDGFGRNRLFETLIAYYENRVVGYASFHKGYDMESASRGIYVIDLFVIEEYRGRKVGTELLKAIGQKCVKNKGKWIAWNVSKKNSRAIIFYEKMKAEKTNSLQYWIEPSKLFAF